MLKNILEFVRFGGVPQKDVYSGKNSVSQATFPVRVVVTGVERSGTTLLSNLLKQHPFLNSGFECGFLLAANPQQFKDIHPWYEWMLEPVSRHHWGLTKSQLKRICNSQTWEEAYVKLIRFSPVFPKEDLQQVCDKTPQYLRCLDSVLAKLPEFVPCLVIEKDLENLWRSHKNRGANLEDFCLHFANYYEGLRAATGLYKQRIHRISYEKLCNDLEGQLRYIFGVVNLPFKQDYSFQYSEQIQRYFEKNYTDVEPLSENERRTLLALKETFSDVLLC